MRLKQLRLTSILKLEDTHYDLAEFTVDQLLCFVFDLSKSSLISRLEDECSVDKISQFNSYLNRILNNEPLDLILGTSQFYKHNYYVSKGVLLPRPETEILVDSLKSILTERFNGHFNGLECGFGTGIISIELALMFPSSQWIAYDISKDAYRCAVKNSENLGCKNVEWKLGNFFESKPVFEDIKKPLCLLSNPPYIPSEDISNLDSSVIDYEPLNALDGGVDGLDFYRQLFQFVLIFPNIDLVALECGINQSSDIKKIARLNGLSLDYCIKDYHNIDRVLIFSK